MIRILLLLGWITVLSAEVYPVDIAPSKQQHTIGSIKILDQKEIILDRIDGIRFAEASDLAYDRESAILYIVGDKGVLYTFKALFSDRIETLQPLHAYRLSKKNGKPFKKKVDSEGLARDKEGQLIISFERKAQISAFSTRGERQHSYTLPKPLRNKKAYRSRNKMLESVAWHPRYGILTASELPLKAYKRRAQTIYALSDKEWHFLAEAEKKSAVTAIEVMDDGNLLILERAYTQPLEARYTSLKKLYLNSCNKGVCRTKLLAKLNSAEGWKIDNFEGLTRVAPHRYLMVSDDNDNFFQRTLLVYFEIME